jgi:hypothetical protein
MKDYSEEITKQIVECITFYPSIFPSHLAVLKHMLLGCGTGYEWVNGRLVHDFRDDRNKKPKLLPEEAEQRFKYGYQHNFIHYDNYSFDYSPLFHIPDDVSKDWLEVIQDFIYTINDLDEKVYKIQLFSDCIRAYGINNPNCYTWFDRNFEEFQKLRKRTFKMAEERDWKWLIQKNLHDPKIVSRRQREIAADFQKILDEADGIVPKCYQILVEREVEKYVRRYGPNTFLRVIKKMKKEKIS